MRGSKLKLILEIAARPGPAAARTIALLTVLALVLVAMPMGFTAERSLDYLNGDDSQTAAVVEFDSPGTDKANSIVVDMFANVTQAVMNITTAPKTASGKDYPTDLSVKIGEDSADPVFEFPGTMGFTETFIGGETQPHVSFDMMAKTDTSTQVSIPKNAVIEQATLDVEGLGSNFNGSLFVNIDFINCIETDPATNAVWYGTSGGLVRMNSSGERTVFTVTDGLSDPNVNDIAIDANSIYIATANGTCKFDKGTQMMDATVWRKGSGLQENETHAVAVDGTHVYIANHIVVSRYNKGTKTFDSDWSKSSGDLNEYSSVTDIMMDGGDIYVSQAFGGVSIYDGASWTYWGGVLTSTNVQALGADSGNIYVCTDWAVDIYNRTSTTWSSLTTSNGMLKNQADCVGIGPNRVFFGTQSGISVFDGQLSHLFNWTKYELGVNIIQAIEYDLAANKLYIGTYGNGTDMYDFNAGGFIPSWITENGPLANKINHVMYNSKRTYFSTDYGVSIFNDDSNLFDTPLSYNTIINFPPDTMIKTSEQIGNILYIGTSNKGVYRWNLQTQAWVNPAFTSGTGLASSNINCLEVDGTNLIIGNAQGVDIYDTSGSGSWVKHLTSSDLPNAFVQSLEATGTKYYIGTAGGIAVYDVGTSSVSETWTTVNKPGLLDNSTRALAIDPATGHLYMGSDKGVSIKYANGTWDNLTYEGGELKTNWVRAIHIDDTYVYVGGILSGVARIQKSNSAITYWDQATRLPHNTVFAFAEDSNTDILYIGTLGGIGRYNLTAGMFFGLSSASNTYPKNPSMDIVGSDAGADWSFAGSFETSQTGIDIASDITDVLAATPADVVDEYGTEFVNVTFEVSVSSNSVGVIALSNLDIRYSLDITTQDFSDKINDYTQAHPLEVDADGNISVPVNVTSASAGKVTLSGFDIVYDFLPRPPVCGWDGLEPTYNFSDAWTDTIFISANCTDPDDDISYYQWMLFKEGLPYPGGTSAGPTFNYTASELGSGNYSLNLTVGDSNGMTDRVSGNFTIGYKPVVDTNIYALITMNKETTTYYESELVILSGNTSYSEAGNITSYRWTRIHDTISYDMGASPVLEMTTLELGFHQFILWVEDEAGNNDTAQVTIDINVPELLSFTGTIQDDAGHDIIISVEAKVSVPNLKGGIEKRTPAVTDDDLPAGMTDIGVFFGITGIAQHFVSCTMTIDLSTVPDPMTTTIPRINDSSSINLFDCGVSPFAPVPNSTLNTDDFIITAHITSKDTIKNNMGLLGEAIPPDGPGDDDITTSDPPTVLATKPAPGESDVALDSSIDIKFSENMDSQILTTSIYVTNQLGIQVKGKLTYNPTEEFQAKFTPDTILSPSIVYTVRVNSSAKSEQGLRLDGNGNGKGGEAGDFYEWSFTTTADEPPEPADDDEPGIVSGQMTIILTIIGVLVVLTLAAVFAFLYFKDKFKEKKIDEEMKDAEGKQMIICTTCGVENEMNSKTCSACGATIGEFKERDEPAVEETPGAAGPVSEGGPMTPEVPERLLAVDITCPSCGAAVTAGMGACSGCGETDFDSVEGVRYQGEAAPAVTEDVICPICQTIVTAGSNQCPSCGEEDLSSAIPASAAAEAETPVAEDIGIQEAPAAEEGTEAAGGSDYTPGSALPRDVTCPICETVVSAGESQCAGCGEEDFSAIL